MHSRAHTQELVERLMSPNIVEAGYDVMAVIQELLNCPVPEVIALLSEQLKSDCLFQRARAAYYLCEFYPTSFEATAVGHTYFATCLRSSEEKVLWSVLSMLPQLTRCTPELSQLVAQQLNHSHAGIVLMATVRLALDDNPPEGVLPKLRQFVQSLDPHAAYLASSTLLQLGLFLHEVVPRLVALSKEPPFHMNAVVGAFYRSRNKPACAAELRGIVETIDPDSPTAAMALCVLGHLDGKSQETMDFICTRLRSDDPRVVTSIRESLIGARYDLPPSAIELLVDKLASPDLVMREAASDCLLAVSPDCLKAHAMVIVDRFVFERDVIVLENVSRICLKLGESAAERLLKILPELGQTKHWLAITTFGHLAHENRVTMMRVIARGNLNPEQARIWATFLGTYKLAGATAAEEMAELLESEDSALVGDTLVALRKAGREAEPLCPKLIELATGPNPVLSSLATGALEAIGSVALRYFTTDEASTSGSSLASLKRHLETQLDQTEAGAFDLNWIGNLADIRAFAAIGAIFRERGEISHKELEKTLSERKAGGQINGDVPTKASTFRALFARLEEAISTRYRRSFSLFEGKATQRRKLSSDGEAFLKKCQKYLSSIRE